MKIKPAVIFTVVLAQIAGLALAALFWSNLSVASWVASTAWLLLALAFMSAFLKKRDYYSSIVWKRVRSASVVFGIVVLVFFFVATRIFRMPASDTSGALIFLCGLGPFVFLVVRGLGRK